MGNPDRPQISHRCAQLARRHRVVAGKGDVPHLDRGAFLDDEVDRHRRGRNGLDVRLYRRKLVPVLGQQGADNVDGACQACRIIGALYRETDVFFLEAVQNVRGRDRVQTLVIDLANRRFLFDDHIENDALGRVFPRDLQILEIARIPQRIEVALDGCRVVDISGMGKQPRQHSLSGNAPVPDHSDLLDCVFRRGSGCSRRRGGALLCPGIQTGTAK